MNTYFMGKQKLPYHHLGSGVLPPDAAHIVTAGCRIVHIGHRSKIRFQEENIPDRRKKMEGKNCSVMYFSIPEGLYVYRMLIRYRNIRLRPESHTDYNPDFL